MFYQLYELNHASLQPARAYADAVRLFYSNPLNPFSHTRWGRSVAAMAELFERTTRRYGKPRFDLTDHDGRLEERGGDREDRLEAAVLQPDPFRARAAGRPQARPQAADRRADVRPLCDAAARHGRSDAAACRSLHHRLDRCAHGAGRRRQVRSRRLYRLPHRHASTRSGRTRMSWRSASHRCRCWRRRPSWRRAATASCRPP